MRKAPDIKSVCESNRCLGCKTKHPLVSIINLEHIDLNRESVKFEFYAILLIKNCNRGYCCGRRHYDYNCATMVFLMPGDILRMNESGLLPEKGWMLVLHPDLLCRTSLDQRISNYSFFFYRKEEALHLSQRETATIICCHQNIEEELKHAIDTHTATILCRQIELMLDYCLRFYERQFITREIENKRFLEELEVIQEECVDLLSIPSAEYCARRLGLSLPYFIDMLKFETGKTFEEYFELRGFEDSSASGKCRYSQN